MIRSNSLAVEVARDMIAEQGVSIEEMGSDTRMARVVTARRLFVYTLRTNTNMSFPEIARAMCKTSHATAVTIWSYIRDHVEGNHDAIKHYKSFAARHRDEYYSRQLRDAKTSRERARIERMIENIKRDKDEQLRLLDSFGLETLGRLTRDEINGIVKAITQQETAA